MISSKKLIRLARKWQNVGRKRISSPRTEKQVGASCSNKSAAAEKGHFVVYTIDQRRYVIPLGYLSSNIFLELFKMSEEEFGLSGDRPIIFPCDAIYMDYIISLIKCGVAKDLDKVFLNSITSRSCKSSATISQGHAGQQIIGLQLLKNTLYALAN